MTVGPVLEWVAQLRPPAQTVWIEAPESATSAGPDGIGDAWQPVFPGTDAEFREDYVHDDRRVGVYAAAFLRQSQGRELVGHGTSLLGKGSWSWVGRESLRRAPGKAESIPWTEREARMGDRHALLWWTYQVGTRRFATAAAEQLWYGTVSLWSQPVSSVVALHVECIPDCDAARQRLQQVVRTGLPRVSSSAPGERQP
jgi:EpsI family protein